MRTTLVKTSAIASALFLTVFLAVNAPLADLGVHPSGKTIPAKQALAQGSIVAWDDFESGNLTGGSGWLDDWHVRGWGGFNEPEITPLGQPYEGSYHLELNGHNSAERSVDLFGQSSLRLQFWAKVDLEGDYAECRVSPDGASWYAVKAWTRDTGYRFVDVDLSPYDMSSEFFVRFQIEDFGGYLHIDDLKIVQGEPVSAPTPAPTPTPSPPPSPTPTPTPEPSPEPQEPESVPEEPQETGGVTWQWFVPVIISAAGIAVTLITLRIRRRKHL